ncbi:MAG: hypothetical protein A3A26_02505 [Candidatus Zambryskibacteria bacterium RIFCSPLOWO2_01_FULL_47_14]|nr:MAG: hypothetical protein A3A26_02505 [Candidatus Zambryskibacteria bacterium RIFCSPLOWO2_01_FULL_47_14]
MPMVFVTVPPNTAEEKWRETEREIIAALRSEGVHGGITCFPLQLAFMPPGSRDSSGRILIGYLSRQVFPDHDDLVAVVSEVTDRILGVQVEGVPLHLKKETHIHITRKKK